MRKIFKSKLFSNLSNQFFLVGFSHIVPLLLIPFLINTIGIEKYGLVNFAFALTFYFQVVNEFGFDNSNVRHVVSNCDNTQRLSEIVSGILGCKTLIGIITSTIYIVIIVSFKTFRADLPLYIFAILRIIFYLYTPYWFFRSLEKIKVITPIVLTAKTLCILPIFFVVKSPNDYVWVMVFYAAETFVASIITLYLMHTRFSIKISIPKIHDIKFYFVDSLPFFYSTILKQLTANSNIVILKLICGNYAAGLYSTAEKIKNAYSSFVSPMIGDVIYPYFLRIKNMKRINLISIGIISANTLIIILLYFLAPSIINLFIKENCNEIINYYNIFLICIFLDIPLYLFGFPYLGIIGKISNVTKATAYATCVYFGIVAILFISNNISIYSLICALILAQVTTLLMYFVYIRKAKRITSISYNEE